MNHVKMYLTNLVLEIMFRVHHGYEESSASSEGIGMNLLSLNEELVVMDSKLLADKLKEITNINGFSS